MALGKLLELGGIDNSPSKAKQDTGKFRVARNVYPTPDKRIIPRYHNSEYSSNSNIKCYHNMMQYDSSIVSLVSEDYSGTYKYSLYKDNIKVPRSSDLSVSPFTTRTDDCPQQVQCNRVSNISYYLSPYDSTLMKYDGVEISYAGVHQPIFSCAQANIAGTKYVRVLQHRLDFEGRVTTSEDVLFPILGTAATIQLRVDGAATNIIGTSVATVSSNLGIISPKIANDVYFKNTRNLYVTSLPGAGGGLEDIYTIISTANSYRWNGTSWVLVMDNVEAGYATKASFPTTGNYLNLYKDLSTGKTYRWGTAERMGIALATLSAFPAIGDSTKYYIAKDTGLIYQYVGGVYVLFPDAGEYFEVISGTSISQGAHYKFSTNDFTIVAFDTNITTENIGAYLVITETSINGSILGLPNNINNIIAYKIKNVITPAGTTAKAKVIVLDALDVKGTDNLALGFTTINTDKYASGFLSDPTTRDTYFLKASRTFFSVWASLNIDGNFFQKGFWLSFPESIVSETTPNIGVASATMAVAIVSNQIMPSQILAEVYDVKNPPISLNENLPTLYGINFGIYCMTSYAGALYFASDSYIFSSNQYTPKMLEMINQNGVYVIGDFEDGRYTTICGTNEFLLVSRERKNYYVTGNIFTGNFRIQNITEAEIGSWGNCSAISIKDSAIFLTSKGIYQTVEGGRTSLVSSKCPKNFASFDSMNVNEDVSFKVDGFLSNPPSDSFIDNSIVIAYDEYRDLLVFMKKGSENPCLILSMRNSEFYEWDGMMKSYSNQYGNCMTFMYSEYYIGGISTSANEAKAVKEDKNIDLFYVTSNPIKLYTTWLTAGEPSLEKILLQLKIFGRVESNGTSNSITICHYKDWNLNTKITNSEYFPRDTSLDINSQVQYSHKKRLNSDKILAASVGLEVNAYPVTFEIESMEVELNSIQEGMKR